MIQFWKMKTFSPRKKNTKKHTSSYFLIFLMFKVFCHKNFIMRAEKTFIKNITIRHAFYSKFATFSDFFSKNPSIFPKKNSNFVRFENFTISVAFYGNLATIWWKKIDIKKREQPMLARLRELNWQTSGKKTHLFERKTLFAIFSIWRNIKTLEIP